MVVFGDGITVGSVGLSMSMVVYSALDACNSYGKLWSEDAEIGLVAGLEENEREHGEEGISNDMC